VPCVRGGIVRRGWENPDDRAVCLVKVCGAPFKDKWKGRRDPTEHKKKSEETGSDGSRAAPRIAPSVNWLKFIF